MTWRVFPSRYLSPAGFGALQAAVAQAPVRRGSTAADDLELFLCSVCSFQQLLDELLQSHFSAGFTCRRLLQELIDLSHLSAEMQHSTAVSDGTVTSNHITSTAREKKKIVYVSVPDCQIV